MKEKFQASTLTPRAKHPYFFGSSDPRGSRKFSGGSGNCLKNSNSRKFLGGSKIWEFRPIELQESG
jgi:hypothetical protein